MVTLKHINEFDLPTLWTIGYKKKDPLWAKYDAPYFHEYKQYTYDNFIKNEGNFFQNKNVYGIFVDELIGYVSYHFISRETQWLEIGITIFDDGHWNKGFGAESLIQFIHLIFSEYPKLEHIGLTTWSGNIGMMKLAKKIGMKEEATIRKVRYYKNVYYDSMKYGILREEFYQ